jgi:HD-GYP domain-containing protein (c-di-GMP phosphodiesterase class II)
VAEAPLPEPDEIRTAEVIGSLCLATDLAVGLPFEHGLRSTVVTMRLAERLGVGTEEAAEAYYGCMLFYAGCTADAELSSSLFPPDALLEHFAPVMFGSRSEGLRGVFRALGGTGGGPVARAARATARLPMAARGHAQHLTAMCEVAQMLSDRLGMTVPVQEMVRILPARWDGQGAPAGLSGDQLPISLRIVHVARDAAFQCWIGGPDHAAEVIRTRAGKAFDPDVAGVLVDHASSILEPDEGGSEWEESLALEPGRRILVGAQIDRALAAMGDFADLVSACFLGHSSAVADLAADAAGRLGCAPEQMRDVRRAGLVHDLGRVAVDASVWSRPGTLTADEWEHVRLHAYHTERVLTRSPGLAHLGDLAGAHHERVDGSGYHRGVTGASLGMPARLLAAADAYRTHVEIRPHRSRRTPEEAAGRLGDEVQAGRLDRDAVAAVLAAAGQSVPRLGRPAGLTEREAQVIALLARGLQTKQAARHLGISPKTADRHVQNAYAKIGCSTRAAAALFAMEHGLTHWGELPIPEQSSPS